MVRKKDIQAAQQGASSNAAAVGMDLEKRQDQIREAAYYHYVERGFVPGHDIEDWLAAEAELGITETKH